MEYDGEDSYLYIAKKHWTNRFDLEREATIGVFFCVWVSPELVEKQEYAYNIHSKQLHKLPTYKLASREFANEFPKIVKTRVSSWPNIRMDYGPITLLEGRGTLELGSFKETIEERISEFVGIHAQIDKLLEVSALSN